MWVDKKTTTTVPTKTTTTPSSTTTTTSVTTATTTKATTNYNDKSISDTAVTTMVPPTTTTNWNSLIGEKLEETTMKLAVESSTQRMVCNYYFYKNVFFISYFRYQLSILQSASSGMKNTSLYNKI